MSDAPAQNAADQTWPADAISVEVRCDLTPGGVRSKRVGVRLAKTAGEVVTRLIPEFGLPVSNGAQPYRLERASGETLAPGVSFGAAGIRAGEALRIIAAPPPISEPPAVMIVADPPAEPEPPSVTIVSVDAAPSPAAASPLAPAPSAGFDSVLIGKAPSFIRVSISDQTNSISKTADVPDDAPISQLAPVLVTRLGLPTGQYGLLCRRLQRSLQENESLASAGVQTGDELRLIPVMLSCSASLARGNGVGGHALTKPMAPPGDIQITLAELPDRPPTPVTLLQSRPRGWEALSSWQHSMAILAGVALALALIALLIR